jgi:lauroyl/myristoyl acyltransferase
MKDPLRSAAKTAFYRIHPVLRAFWFPIKVAEYFLIHPLLSWLPLEWAHRIFRLRWPWLFMMPSEKELILRNLSIAFQDKLPPSRLTTLGAEYARFLSCLRFDAWISSSLSPQRINKTIQFEGLSHLREAQEQGKGVVLLGSHTGYSYRFVFALARNGYRFQVITMKTEKTGRIVWRGRAELILYRKILERMEAEENIRIIYAGWAYREIQSSLREKQILLTKMDNPPLHKGDKGVRVMFLGHECLFSSEIFRAAKQQGAVCLPYVVHMDGHSCRFRIYPPWEPGRLKASVDDSIAAQIEYFIRLFEEHILSCPEQWWLWRDLGAFGSSPLQPPPVDDDPCCPL